MKLSEHNYSRVMNVVSSARLEHLVTNGDRAALAALRGCLKSHL